MTTVEDFYKGEWSTGVPWIHQSSLGHRSTGSLLSFSLLTAVLPLMRLTTLFLSIVSLLVLASWMLLTIGSDILSRIQSFSVTSGSTSYSISPSSCGVPQGSVLGPIFFTIDVSPSASIVSSHGVNQRQYADNAQLFLSIFPSSLSCSLQQRCFSSLRI